MPPKRRAMRRSKTPAKSKAISIIDGKATSQMTHDELEYHILNLKEELNRERNERNLENLEKNKLMKFWEITKHTLEDCKAELHNKERELEVAEENKTLETEIYKQKIKHLLYEQQNITSAITSEASIAVQIAREEQMNVEKQMREANQDLKNKMRQNDARNHIGVLEMTREHEKKLHDLREDFESQLEEQRKTYEENLIILRKKLELQRKNDLQEMEERKNNHINTLLNSHEKSMSDMKNYYNDITANNLQLINQLKDQLKEESKLAENLERQLAAVNEENRQLVEPLEKLRKENKELTRKMINYEKDLKSLEITKEKLKASEKRRKNADCRVEIMKQKSHLVEKERDELYEKFVSAIHEVQQKTGLKNLLLEKRLAAMSEDIERKDMQLHEILAASNLEPQTIEHVTRQVDNVITSKNSTIKELHYELARVCKAHNDLAETCMDKMRQFGIPIEELGFEPLRTIFPTRNLGQTPAGLVSVPP